MGNCLFNNHPISKIFARLAAARYCLAIWFNAKGAPVLLSLGESLNSPLTGRCGGQLAARTEVRPWSHLVRGKLVAFRLWSHLSNCLPVLNWMNGTNPPPRTSCSIFLFLFFFVSECFPKIKVSSAKISGTLLQNFFFFPHLGCTLRHNDPGVFARFFSKRW